MQKFFSTGLLMACCLFLSSQSVYGNEQLKQRLSDFNSFEASFEQVVYDQDEAIDSASGQLTLMRPNKMRWETTFPDETLLIADGTSIWNIDSFVEQVTIFPQQDVVTSNPMMLLTSEDPAVWESFSVKVLESAGNSENQQSEIYEITSLQQDAQIVSLTLRFEEGVLVSLSTQDSQQQVSALTFSDIKTNIDLSDDTFVAEYQDSYTVDDQR